MSDNESQEERRASQRRNNRRCRRRRNIPLPSKLEVTGGHLQSNWKKFRRLWDSYEIVTELKEDQGFRSATFLSCAGSEGLDIFGGLPFDNEEERTKSWYSTAKVWRILHWRKTKQKLLSLMCYETSSCRRVSGNFVCDLKKLIKSCIFGHGRETSSRPNCTGCEKWEPRNKTVSNKKSDFSQYSREMQGFWNELATEYGHEDRKWGYQCHPWKQKKRKLTKCKYCEKDRYSFVIVF